MLAWLRRLWGPVAEQTGDPVPAWLLWGAALLSVAAIGYGLTTDSAGFLLNVAAGVALLWVTALVLPRLLRWRRQRPLRPVVDRLAPELRYVLFRLLDEIGHVVVGLTLPALSDVDVDGTPVRAARPNH